MTLPDASKIYVFGASGTGTTTLGEAVASELRLVHVDCDDHYWAPVDPPFSEKRAPQERVASMVKALGSAGWVLTGACNGWGRQLTDQADLIVFVTLPASIRLRRLRARERARFGDRIEEGGDMFQIHKDFILWAQGYDKAGFAGRNRAAHESWLSQQTRPICRIDGDQPLAASKEAVLSALRAL